jgi:uncharacterized protein YggT (Ycf19 family)
MLKLIFKLAYTAVMFIESIIMIRIVLELIKANTSNTFASWIYNLSDLFTSPFNGLVSSTLQIDKFSISLTPLVALVFYIIVAFVLSELVKAFSRD